MTAPGFAETVRVFARIGLLSFGGPAGQIALLHHELVDNRPWLAEKDFLAALNFCMFLPGPEAMQLATYAGWKLHGLKGGLAAGLLFVLPGAALIFALSALYAAFGAVPLVAALFWGIKCAVVAIVLEALLKVARKSLKSGVDRIIAGASFAALFVFGLPFPLVILAAGVFGFITAQAGSGGVASARPSLARTLRTAMIGLAIWLLPLALMHLAVGPQHILADLSRIFSTLAVVTFGGAYAVLTTLGQVMVEQRHWLTTAEMMDGLGLAETTPGPLILVGQFAGYVAAAKSGGMLAGLAASAVFLWSTFAPCFLWICAGAPWIEHVQSRPRLAGGLNAISAAVVGVVLNLSLWFGLHVVFETITRRAGPVPLWWPDGASLDLPALVLSLVSAVVLLRFKAGIPKTLAFAAVAGLFWQFAATQI
jgi:chromate transporter